MKETNTLTNRYGNEYHFTPDSDGNLLWEGDFKWCRYGMPNDYSKAYRQYVDDGTPFGFMEMEEFKEKVHEYDDEKREYVMKDYVQLVESRTDKISMVDPSGGPFIQEGMDPGNFHPDMNGKKIKGFEPIEGGYKIIMG
jgi:hypothetical protein